MTTGHAPTVSPLADRARSLRSPLWLVAAPKRAASFFVPGGDGWHG
jgi:hypothetical protein